MGTEADEAKAKERTARSTEHIEGRVTLERIGNKMAPALFNRELEQVLANIVDPNTDPRGKREIVLRFKFKPSEKRDQVGVLIEATSKLCPVKPQDATIYVGRRGGRVLAVEDNPKQRGLFDSPKPVVEPLNGGGDGGEDTQS